MLPDECAHSNVLISIATYKRPELLAQLLDSLEDQAIKHGADVVVVDNDAELSARTVCATRSNFVRYVPESKPGIAAARNRGLHELNEHEYVAFVDDDEAVASDWLANLIGCADAHSADLVCGPVLSSYPEGGYSRWLVRAGFFQRARHPTGQPVDLPATNNTLVKVEALYRLDDPTFSEAFSASGGSDNELFWRLGRSGARMIWCDEAIVTEQVLIQRISYRWVIRRGIRHGNVLARLWSREKPRLSVATEGIVRVLIGASRALFAVACGRSTIAQHLQTMLRGVGILQELAGLRVEEYRR